MEQVEKPPVWGRLFVAGLIFAGIGLTGASIVTRLQAIENYPRVAYDILQQSCDTRALIIRTPYAHTGTQDRTELSKFCAVKGGMIAACRRI